MPLENVTMAKNPKDGVPVFEGGPVLFFLSFLAERRGVGLGDTSRFGLTLNANLCFVPHAKTRSTDLSPWPTFCALPINTRLSSQGELLTTNDKLKTNKHVKLDAHLCCVLLLS